MDISYLISSDESPPPPPPLTDMDIDDVDIDDVDVNVVPSVEIDTSCCVCFTEYPNNNPIYTLTDIPLETITDDTLIKSACNEHFICIKCLHTIVTDYINHPINENNSHVYCPYPFENCITFAQTRNVFDHEAILKILKDDLEKQQFMEHASRFQFPGFTIINCPCSYYVPNEINSRLCNYPVLIENEFIKSADIGDLIIQCHQNEKCCKPFCFHCRKEVSRYERECRTCKLFSENENPNILNRYMIKYNSIEQVSYDDEGLGTNYFDEADYLLYNKEITKEYALEYIETLIEHNVHCICPICKIHLHKTEKCNGMRHHNVERCYACGRIGTRTGGLHNNHWNTEGIGGCYRFDYDKFVSLYIPEYKCNDRCQSHENGDCQLPEHLPGIQKMAKIRQRAIIYHCIKSLLPELRYDILQTLYDKYTQIPTAYELLPYKQTFVFLEEFKEIQLDYSEESIYTHLKSTNPSFLPEYIDKTFIIDAYEYMDKYKLPEEPEPIPEPSIPLPPPPPIFTIPPTPPPRRPPPPPPRLRVINELVQNMLDRLADETQPLLPQEIHQEIPEEIPEEIHEEEVDLSTLHVRPVELDERDLDELDNITEPDIEINFDNIRIYYNMDTHTNEMENDEFMTRLNETESQLNNIETQLNNLETQLNNQENQFNETIRQLNEELVSELANRRVYILGDDSDDGSDNEQES